MRLAPTAVNEASHRYEDRAHRVRGPMLIGSVLKCDMFGVYHCSSINNNNKAQKYQVLNEDLFVLSRDQEVICSMVNELYARVLGLAVGHMYISCRHLCE